MKNKNKNYGDKNTQTLIDIDLHYKLWLKDCNKKSYNFIWIESQKMCKYYICSVCNKIGYRLDYADLQDLTIDATIKIIERINQRQKPTIRNWGTFYYWTASNAMRTNKTRCDKFKKMEKWIEILNEQSLFVDDYYASDESDEC